ncbi:MAG: putative toxin-antitoxin system toxin component, PIN family [Candidatus Marinimicrobia bacterium]|nr:putative toxin-antitoxin system toxin component, PIN family [Candidatus Neomarinimicrobiota bacterium]
MTSFRVVLDSNVIISGFLFSGPPAHLLKCALHGSVQICISLAMLDEVRDVLQRPKFGLSSDQALTLIEDLHDLCQIVTPTTHVHVIVADPDDNAILECAGAAGAELIVSGDAHLLALGKWQGIDILRPADAIKRIARQAEDNP